MRALIPPTASLLVTKYRPALVVNNTRRYHVRHPVNSQNWSELAAVLRYYPRLDGGQRREIGSEWGRGTVWRGRRRRWLSVSSRWMLTGCWAAVSQSLRRSVCLQLIAGGVRRGVDYVWSAGESGHCQLHRKQLHAYGQSSDADCEDFCWSAARLQSAKPVQLWRLAYSRQITSHGMSILLDYCAQLHIAGILA